MPYIGPSESQSVAMAMPRPPLYRGVKEAVAWFKAEWQAGLPAKVHEDGHVVGDGDHLGGPAFTHRFTAYIFDGPRDPLRRALAEMARGSLLERVGASYLFVLACCDFDPVTAGLAMMGCHCPQERHEARSECPGWTAPIMPAYAPYYAEKAIERLRERIGMLDRVRRSYQPCARQDCTERTDRRFCATHSEAA